MFRIYNYTNFISINESEENDSLNKSLWDKDKNGNWILDKRAKRKIVSLAKQFYSEFKKLLKQRDIYDIQITGSMSNFNYSPDSEIDVHVLVNFDDIDKGNLSDIKKEVESICFEWDLNNNPKFKGHDIDLFVQDKRDPHEYSALYSVMDDKWIKHPNQEEIEIDDRDVDKKYDSIIFSIERLDTLIKEGTDNDRIKRMYKKGLELKTRIQKMKRVYDTKNGSSTIEGMVYKKLKNSGYIEKLIEILSYAYEKVF